MKRINSMLKRLERALKPLKQTILVYGRKGIENEDSQRQINEYRQIFGDAGQLVCVQLRDGYDPKAPYEQFIAFRRGKEDPANCLVGWWRLRGES